MIHLDKIVADIKDIDPVWTFSYYCKIPCEQFNGSTIKIKSVFKPDEKTPSFCIYFKNGKVMFKDFSTSISGDHINLVQQLFNLNYSQSCFKIVKDYTRFVLDNDKFIKSDITTVNKYEVIDHSKRPWNVNDKNFWLPFGIGSSRLQWGIVHPLEGYSMSNGISPIQISGEYIYGYFTRTGDLYKIYQPTNKDCKFLNVKDYEVGSEHEEGHKFCGILSSWKDIMCFKSFGLNIDLKAPSSENSFLSKKYIDRQKKKYKKVFTLFDADEAGKTAMLKYKEIYNLDYVYLPLSKDISDSYRDYGKNKVLTTVLPLIHKIIN